MAGRKSKKKGTGSKGTRTWSSKSSKNKTKYRPQDPVFNRMGEADDTHNQAPKGDADLAGIPEPVHAGGAMLPGLAMLPPGLGALPKLPADGAGGKTALDIARIAILLSCASLLGTMYRNHRPAPLNMSLVPGQHLSTSKCRCPFPPTPDEDTATCSPDQCESTSQCGSGNCSTSADAESLASSGAVGVSGSAPSEASQDVASAPGEPGLDVYGETSSPLDSMLLKKKRDRAMLQKAGHGKAAEPSVVEAYDLDDADCREPSSPLGGMLLRAKRQNAFTCDLWCRFVAGA